jgi:hypothetical protein
MIAQRVGRSSRALRTDQACLSFESQYKAPLRTNIPALVYLGTLSAKRRGKRGRGRTKVTSFRMCLPPTAHHHAPQASGARRREDENPQGQEDRLAEGLIHDSRARRAAPLTGGAAVCLDQCCAIFCQACTCTLIRKLINIPAFLGMTALNRGWCRTLGF